VVDPTGLPLLLMVTRADEQDRDIARELLWRQQAADRLSGLLAWGRLPGRYCAACNSFRQNHPVAECAGCHRNVSLKKDYCRLCWCQASLDAKGTVTVRLIVQPAERCLAREPFCCACGVSPALASGWCPAP
jgi:hypothetical protein